MVFATTRVFECFTDAGIHDKPGAHFDTRISLHLSHNAVHAADGRSSAARRRSPEGSGSLCRPTGRRPVRHRPAVRMHHDAIPANDSPGRRNVSAADVPSTTAAAWRSTGELPAEDRRAAVQPVAGRSRVLRADEQRSGPGGATGDDVRERRWISVSVATDSATTSPRLPRRGSAGVDRHRATVQHAVVQRLSSAGPSPKKHGPGRVRHGRDAPTHAGIPGPAFDRRRRDVAAEPDDAAAHAALPPRRRRHGDGGKPAVKDGRRRAAASQVDGVVRPGAEQADGDVWRPPAGTGRTASEGADQRCAVPHG